MATERHAFFFDCPLCGAENEAKYMSEPGRVYLPGHIPCKQCGEILETVINDVAAANLPRKPKP